MFFKNFCKEPLKRKVGINPIMSRNAGSRLKPVIVTLFCLCIYTDQGATQAKADVLTVLDISTAFKKGDAPTVGYVTGLVRGSVLMLALMQNDCSPSGNRHSVAARVIDKVSSTDQLQNDPKIDQAIYSISLKMFACDKGAFLPKLPQLGFSE